MCVQIYQIDQGNITTVCLFMVQLVLKPLIARSLTRFLGCIDRSFFPNRPNTKILSVLLIHECLRFLPYVNV